MILVDSNQHHFYPDITKKLRKVDEVSVESLPVADYAYGEIGVEWKEAGDFLNSISDGRLFGQAKGLSSNFSTPIIIIIGNVYKSICKTKFHWRSYLGAKASLVRSFGISTIDCYDHEEAVDFLRILFEQEKKGGSGEKRPIINPRTFSLVDRRLSALSCIEGISMKKAEKLLDEFGSLLSIAEKDEWELRHIEGIGEKLAKNIYEFWR